MRRSLFIFLGLTVLTLGVYLTAEAQPTAADTLSGLVAEETDFIKKTLGKKDLEKDKKSQRKMRLAALMIAQYAQSGIRKDNPRSASLATLRDQALAVRKAVEDGNFDQAKKLASLLTVNIAPNAAAKLQAPDLLKLEEFDSIMSQFSSARLGGFGLEDYLETLSELKENPKDEDAKKAYLFGKKVAMVAALAEAHVPPTLGGAKTIQAWKGFVKTMNEDSISLSKAAETKSAAAISKAAVKLTDACKSCHDVFR